MAARLQEAHRLIVDRAHILFPGTSGAVCMTASSRDIVEVVARWGEPALAESFFAPKDCWALRLGRVHLLDRDPAMLSCAHLGCVRPDHSMCVPMMAHGEALGLLYLDTGHPGNGNSSRPGSSGEALLRAADSALYRAKQEGRDRVVRASVLKSEQPAPALRS